MIFEIIYEAKCKHCANFKSEKKIKKDGSKSKINRYYCEKKHKTWNLDKKEKACDKFEF